MFRLSKCSLFCNKHNRMVSTNTYNSFRVQNRDINSPIFNVHGSAHHKNILIYVQQDATLHSLFIWKLLYMFRVVAPPITGSAYNCIYSIWLFVTLLLLPAVIAAGSSNGVTNTRCCRYSCLRSR